MDNSGFYTFVAISERDYRLQTTDYRLQTTEY